jgi:outer membrane protein assembly factor BamB
MRYRILFSILFLAATTAFAQKPAWELKLGTEIYNPTLSPDGKHLLYFTRQDAVSATCIDVSSGTKLWSKPLKNFKQYRIGRFIGNDTVLVGQENRYEFLNARDGSVIKTLPIIGDDWSDLRWEEKADAENDTLRPYFKGSIGIFYFDDGTQILDLKHLSIIHQTEESPSKIKYKEWENVLLINPTSGGDSIYFVDVDNGKLLYKASKDNDLNSSVYQPFAVSNGEMLLFNEDNIQSIDLATARQDAIIPVDPDDPEFYSPVIFKKGLYLMVSDEGIQKLYNAKDGKLLWETAKGAVPGIAEQIVELPNDEALLMGYEEDGKMTTYKINANTGKTLWKKDLFVQDGKLETGHKEGSKVWATIGKIAVLMLTMPSRYNTRWGGNSYSGFGFGYHDGFGFGYNENPFYRSERDAAVRRANNMYNSWINTKKSSDGYTYVLTTNDKQVMLATAGKVYSLKDGKPSENYDGEGILTLNLADGSVVSWTKCEMLAKSESGDFNAYKDLNVTKLDSAQTLVGTHEVYILRGDNVEKFSFGEETLSFINAGPNAITFVSNHDGDYYDYWRIDASSVPSRKHLIARSTYPNVVFHDSLDVSTMLRVDEKGIAAYPVKDGDVSDASFASPKWSLADDDLDKLELGDLGEKVGYTNRMQGIRIAGGDVYLMGEDALAYVSSDGTCRWTEQWEPELLKTKVGVTTLGHGLIYSTGDITSMLSNQCPPRVIGRDKIDFSDSVVLLSNVTNEVVVINTDDGIIHEYSMN